MLATVQDPRELARLQKLAAAGRFGEVLAACQHLAQAHPGDAALQQTLGTLLGKCGLLTDAQACYRQALQADPSDLSAVLNLANAEREAGEHALARQRYQALQRALPNNRIVWRNALTGLEYDPQATDAERLQHAREWGSWAIARADAGFTADERQRLHPKP